MMNYELSAMNCHYRFYERHVFFSHVQQSGLTNVELWTAPQHFFMDYSRTDDPIRLKEEAAQYGLKIICICPEQTNPKPNNIAVKGKQRQAEVLRYYQNAVDTAAAIGNCKVLVTPGWAFYNEELSEATKRSVEMLQKISAYGNTKGVLLVLEALQADESTIANSCAHLKKLTSQVNAPNLKICIDFGAMAGAGNTLEDYFEMFGGDIAHIHFVDGRPTGHLAWGDGTRDMRADLQVLSQYNYQGYLSLETATSRYFKEPWLADRQTAALFKKTSEEISG